VGEAVRHALNSLAVVAPAWLQPHLHPAWAERYGHRVEQFRLPDTLAARQALAASYGADGQALLDAVDAPSAPGWLREAPAVVTLRRIWAQQYERDGPGAPLHWRADAALPAAPELINSPYDPDAHYSMKRTTTWTGYKVHLTETCEPDLPLVVTQVQTSPAPEPDVQTLPAIQAALGASAVAPGLQVVDQGYLDAETLVTSAQEHGIQVVGPVAHDTSWQAKEGGFTLEQFRIDWAAQQVECPGGAVSQRWREQQAYQTNVIRVSFAAADCQGCRLAAYATRAGVEGLLSQGVQAYGLRRSRYVGQAKTHLQHVVTAVALTLVRVVSWVLGTVRARTREARFVRLMGPGLIPASG
jgi:transposase